MTLKNLETGLARIMGSSAVRDHSGLASLYASLPLEEGNNIRVLDLLPGTRGQGMKARLRLVCLDDIYARSVTLVEARARLKKATDRPWRSEQYPEIKYQADRAEKERLKCQQQFEALSYTWGTIIRRHTIELNNEVTLEITDNLYQALRRLRYLRRTRTLWVDALCINQADLSERARQVQMVSKSMGKRVT